MAEVGAAAAAGGDPGRETMGRFRDLASTAPLEPEPFLVQAALASRSGELDRAEQLLLRARQRDPRSVAARYLLADVRLRRGETLAALREMTILGRLVPGSSIQLVPALSEYARSPNAREELAPILAANPELKAPLLNALSAEPANADLVLALAGSGATSADPAMKAWKERLLAGLIASGDYDRAHAVWRRMAGVSGGQRALLFNPGFARLAAPPPFNWRLGSSAAGIAEPAGGRLRILFYGRENASLASQLLLLAPGAYRFRAPVSGSLASGALSWKITCTNSRTELMRIDAEAAAGSFKVPRNCPAQQIELAGAVTDMPRDSDIQVGPAVLERTGN